MSERKKKKKWKMEVNKIKSQEISTGKERHVNCCTNVFFFVFFRIELILE